MATRAASGTAARSEHLFYTGMAIAMIAFVVAGFAPTYYFASYLGRVPPEEFAALSPLVHVHATVSMAWMLLFAAQASLVAAGRRDLHRIIGPAGAALVAIIVVVGIATALEGAHAGRVRQGFSPEAFLFLPLSITFLLVLFSGLAFYHRKRAQHHKRLMLLATITILVPAGARFSRFYLEGILPPGPIGGMILSDLFLAALVIHDLRSRGSLHPVTLWGGGLLLLSEPLRLVIAQSTAWQSFAHGLIA